MEFWFSRKQTCIFSHSCKSKIWSCWSTQSSFIILNKITRQLPQREIWLIYCLQLQFPWECYRRIEWCWKTNPCIKTEQNPKSMDYSYIQTWWQGISMNPKIQVGGNWPTTTTRSVFCQHLYKRKHKAVEYLPDMRTGDLKTAYRNSLKS